MTKDLIDPGHFKALAEMAPSDVCRRTGAQFNEDGTYSLNIWGRKCIINPHEGEVSFSPGTLHEYFSLFAIHYLLTGQDEQVQNEWISEKDMPGGATFFRGPHEITSSLITAAVDNSVDKFGELCKNHGGTPLEMADAAYVLQITDRIPVAVLFWEGDDEFPAESKLLFDKSLTRHFALDIVFALAIGICEELGGTSV